MGILRPKPGRIKKLLSYFIDVSILKTRSDQHEELELLLSAGEYKLNTPFATYSYGEKYHAFRDSFEKLDFLSREFNKVLVLGGGLGSVALLLDKQFAQSAHYDLVEIDSKICELASLTLPPAILHKTRIHNVDAIKFLEDSIESYDLIIVDLFQDLDVPDQFLSSSFVSKLSSQNEDLMVLFNTISVSEEQRRISQSFYAENFKNSFKSSGSLLLSGNIVHWGEKSE